MNEIVIPEGVAFEGPVELDELCGTRTLRGVRKGVRVFWEESASEYRGATRYRREYRRASLLLWLDDDFVLFTEGQPNTKHGSYALIQTLHGIDALTKIVRPLDKPRVVEARHKPRRIPLGDPLDGYEYQTAQGQLYLLDEATNLVICEVGTSLTGIEGVHADSCFMATWDPNGYTPGWMTPK